MITIFIKTVVSLLYWCFIIKLSPLVTRLSHELGRKFVHLFVSFWWFFALYFYDDFWSSSIVPLIFIFINTHATFNKKSGFVASLNREEKSKSYGLICYPVGFIIILWSAFYIFSHRDIAGLSVMTMGFGDTGAAIIGNRYNWRTYYIGKSKKSGSGMIGMFIFTFISTLLYSLLFSYSSPVFVALACGVVGSLVESVSIKGTDNITVPLSIIVLCRFLF